MIDVSPWSGLEPAHIGFCEARLDGWIAEPANAWSSFVYVIVGAWLLARASNAGRRDDVRSPLLLVGATAILVGLGSFAFHATASFAGEFADEASMFLISALMLTLALRRLLAWDGRACAWSFALLASSATALLARFHGSGVVVFTLHIAAAIACELALWRRGDGATDFRPLAATLATFGAAYAVWWLDLGKVVCDPANHVFGGHAAWHSLTAATLALYQRFQEQFVTVVPAPVPALAASPAPAPRAPEPDPGLDPIALAVESLRSIRVALESQPDSVTFH